MSSRRGTRRRFAVHIRRIAVQVDADLRVNLPMISGKWVSLDIIVRRQLLKQCPTCGEIIFLQIL